MLELIELIRLININRLKSSGLWAILLEQGSMLEQLCAGIHAGQITSDMEAAALLYPGQAGGTKFYNLKERLKERLVNAAFLLEFQAPSFANRQKAYFESNKKWSAANLFMSKGARLVGIEMLEDLIKQSMQFEFTELTLYAGSMLRLHYGTILGDRQRYEQYRQLCQHYRRIWMMESEAEELYTHLASYYVNAKATRKDIADTALLYYAQIVPYLAESTAFRLHLCGRMIQLTIHTSQNDYPVTAQLCEDAILFFRQKPFDSSTRLSRSSTTSWWSAVSSCDNLSAAKRPSKLTSRCTRREPSTGTSCSKCFFCWPSIPGTTRMRWSSATRSGNIPSSGASRRKSPRYGRFMRPMLTT